MATSKSVSPDYNWPRFLIRVASIWLPLAVVITCLASLLYTAIQQDIRQSANDPQIRLAEDDAAQLDAGTPPEKIVPSTTVEMRQSLAPYVMVFDNNHSLLTASAVLDGKTPDFPSTVFDNLKRGGEKRFTWAPRPEVRSAVVATTWKGGFVVTGRSLRVVEQREDQLAIIVLFGWLATMVVSLLATRLGGFAREII